MPLSAPNITAQPTTEEPLFQSRPRETVCRRYRFKTSPLSSHGKILRHLVRLPPETRILDVGTANGYLGQALREAGFQQVVGLEQDPLRAQEARSLYARIIEQDLEDLSPESLGGPYDAIVCADVLEHLKDPWAALRRLVLALAPNGQILLSIPNSGHWWVRLNVLCGRFPMDSRGLFDSGHLRFFTRRSLRQLVHQAGLSMDHCWVTPIPLTLLSDQPIFRKPAQAGEWIYWILSHTWKNLFAYQFVLVARPTGC